MAALAACACGTVCVQTYLHRPCDLCVGNQMCRRIQFGRSFHGRVCMLQTPSSTDVSQQVLSHNMGEGLDLADGRCTCSRGYHWHACTLIPGACERVWTSVPQDPSESFTAAADPTSVLLPSRYEARWQWRLCTLRASSPSGCCVSPWLELRAESKLCQLCAAALPAGGSQRHWPLQPAAILFTTTRHYKAADQTSAAGRCDGAFRLSCGARLLPTT